MLENKKENAYLYIKEQIILGKIPPMTSISEDELAKELGVSRMPIHQAILQLSADGFVYIFPRKGTVVADITLDTIRWVYEMRRIIEPYLTRKACDVLKREWLDEMLVSFETVKAELEKAPSSKALEDAMIYDKMLHSAILDCSDNRLMSNMLTCVCDYDQWIRIRISHANQNYLESVNAHIRIIRALILKDKDLAEREMINHIVFSENEAVKYK